MVLVESSINLLNLKIPTQSYLKSVWSSLYIVSDRAKSFTKLTFIKLAKEIEINSKLY
jgi:hypothetical protein